MKRGWVILLIAAGLLAALAGLLFIRRPGHSLVVNLDVHDMEVRPVVRQVERQTGITVVVSEGVQGKLTLYLHDVPVDLALDLIARQVGAHAGHVYPVYSSPGSLAELKHLIASQTTHAQTFSTWTNFVFHHAAGAGGHGKKKVNVHIDQRDPRLAAMAVSFAVHAQVVTEDGLTQPVKLDLQQSNREAAVGQLARLLKCSWSDFYFLRPAKLEHGPAKTPEQKLERKEAKHEASSKEKRERKDQLQSLPLEERTELKELRSQDPAFQQKVSEHALDSIRQCTPEQIVERRRQNAKAVAKSVRERK